MGLPPQGACLCPAQDEELLGHIQSAILQVQGDCEKLSITTSNLIEDRQQKQKDIDVRAGRGVGAGLGRDRFPAPILCSLGLPGVVPGSGEAGEGEGQQGTPGDGNRRGKARPEERPPREVPSLPLLKRLREERSPRWEVGSASELSYMEQGPAVALAHLGGGASRPRLWAESRQECPGGQSEPRPV